MSFFRERPPFRVCFFGVLLFFFLAGTVVAGVPVVDFLFRDGMILLFMLVGGFLLYCLVCGLYSSPEDSSEEGSSEDSSDSMPSESIDILDLLVSVSLVTVVVSISLEAPHGSEGDSICGMELWMPRVAGFFAMEGDACAVEGGGACEGGGCFFFIGEGGGGISGCCEGGDGGARGAPTCGTVGDVKLLGCPTLACVSGVGVMFMSGGGGDNCVGSVGVVFTQGSVGVVFLSGGGGDNCVLFMSGGGGDNCTVGGVLLDGEHHGRSPSLGCPALSCVGDVFMSWVGGGRAPSCCTVSSCCIVL